MGESNFSAAAVQGFFCSAHAPCPAGSVRPLSVVQGATTDTKGVHRRSQAVTLPKVQNLCAA